MHFSGKEMTLYMTREDLPEDLRSYLDDDRDPYVFRHPFYTSIYPMPLPMKIEDLLAHKESQFLLEFEAPESKDISFVHVSRPFRMDKLIECQKLGLFKSPRQYWEAVRDVWVDSETNESAPIWRAVLEANMPDRQKYIMSAEEQEEFSALPDVIEIYRGVQGGTKAEAEDFVFKGFSWSLSYKTAAFFANRFLSDGDEAYVAKARVRKENIIALFMQRGEEEVVVDFRDPSIFEDLEMFEV